MLTGLIFLALLLITGSGAVAGALTHNQEVRQAQARETYNYIVLRNGVTEESPFSNLHEPVNAPGLVQVFPRSQTPTPTPPLAASTAPVPAPARVEPLPTKERQPDDGKNDAKKITATKETKFKWGYPQGGFSVQDVNFDARDAIHRLVEDGERRKTVLSWAVFGSSGGSTYAAAKPFIEEALKNVK